MTIAVERGIYENCPGSASDSDDHSCPLVIYQNDKARCSHHACEGRRAEWGEIIGIQFVHK